MSEKNRFAKRRKIEQQAEIWFDVTDDRVHFEAFSDQQEKISVGEEMLEVIRQKISFRKRLVYWSRMATAAVLLLTTGIVSYQSYQNPTVVAQKQDWLNYTAARGEFKQIILPDSSVIHLRPGATVSISRPFVQKNREVKLQQGEVYFEVSHDPSHPFMVRTGQMTTEVLGTKFIINNDPLLADIQVALLSGKVVVRNQKAELGVLLPKQQLFYHRDKETVKLESSIIHAEKWLNGEYVLEDVPLKLFAQSFSNAFAMEVKFKHRSLENLYVSIQFNRSDEPRAILDQLKLIHGLHYEMKDKEVILMK